MTEIQLRRKVLRRFYEPLLLLNALGQMRGERTKPEASTNDSSPNLRKLRRSFADGLAYICAFEKDPDRVTAVGLAKTPQGILVLLAANGKVGENVVQFLEKVLSDIQRISELGDRNDRQREAERLEEDLTSRIIAFNRSRILSYYKQVVQGRDSKCLEIISGELETSGDRSREMRLAEWLRENFGSGSSTTLEDNEVQALVRTCYENRRSSAFETLKYLAGQGETRRLDFQQLHELLYKLSKHVHIAKKLIEAAISLSQDFMQEFQIQVLPPSKELKMPLTSKEATVESTIHRMFSDPVEQSEFMARLQHIWDPSEVSQVLQKQHHKTKTRVHAELLLVAHFDRYECFFLDGDDRYIGCSKPACYLCHAFIKNHPGRYAVPSSHQKLYLAWRHPDIDPGDKNGVERQEGIMLKLIDRVRRDIITDIESRTKRLPYHADSVGRSSRTQTVASNVQLLHEVDLHEALDINSPETTTVEDLHPQPDIPDDSDDESGVPVI